MPPPRKGDRTMKTIKVKVYKFSELIRRCQGKRYRMVQEGLFDYDWVSVHL